jgi:hypothetical protein
MLTKRHKPLTTHFADDEKIPAIKAAPKHTIPDIDAFEAEFIDSSTAAELDANLSLTASPGKIFLPFLDIQGFS